MELGELRDHMLVDHRDLRRRLNEVEALAVEVAMGASNRSETLCTRGLELLGRLESRSAWEEHRLLPAIRECYGPGRAARAKTDLVTQRELLRFQIDALVDRRWPLAFVANGLLDFATLFRNGIEQEEQLLFDPDLLGESEVFGELGMSS